MPRIYLDHHATTPVDSRVVAAMQPWWTERFGNPASPHAFGWEADDAVEAARAEVAAAIGAEAREIVFTSGTTESVNLALKGAVEASKRPDPHVVTSAIEHRAVLDTCAWLERRGVAVTRVPVDAAGRVDPTGVAAACTDRTVAISVMAANNEIGTLQPVAAIGAFARSRGIAFHTDAAQAVTKVPFDVRGACVDLCSFSAHKLYGPKGVGALYVRRSPPRVRVAPQLHGGGHERGLRSGTLPVPLIVGFGAACRIGLAERERDAAHAVALRERLWAALSATLDGLHQNGHSAERLPGNLSVAFAGVHGEGLLMQLRDVAVASGSACTAASLEPSHVLLACGLPPDLAHATLRFGIGRGNTEAEIDHVAAEVARVVRELRAHVPVLPA